MKYRKGCDLHVRKYIECRRSTKAEQSSSECEELNPDIVQVKMTREIRKDCKGRIPFILKIYFKAMDTVVQS